MFTHCVFCHRSFEENQSLEHLRAGRHVAYDPAQGRLWHICTSCRRWTLAPIEERWEALEELERLVTDRSRLLAETDNIALLRSEDLKIVRVGRTDLTEEAWWRFGREFKRRRTVHQVWRAAGVGTAIYLGATGFMGMLGGGFGIWLAYRTAKRFPELGRRVRFGKTAWRGEAVCSGCGTPIRRIEFDELSQLRIDFDPSGGLTVDRACMTCRRQHQGGGYMIKGAHGDHLVRRALAFRNYAGAGEVELRHAMRAIEGAGSPGRLARRVAHHRAPLGRLIPIDSLALEIAVNEESERRLLEMELAEIEARWRTEEEIASIADGELTPVSGFGALRRLVSGDPD